MKRFFKQFRYGEKGFTLIELLVVVAILGVLAAIAIPNVGKFLGKGHEEAASTELHNVQTAVMAAMADLSSGNVSSPGTLDAATDIDVDGDGSGDIGDFIVGGVLRLQGEYTVSSDGTVEQVSYPGYTP